MAVKRMFSSSVTETDNFYSLPIKSQLLYFRFGMHQTTGGKVLAPHSIMRWSGFSNTDLEPLILAGFVSIRDNEVFVAFSAREVKRFKKEQ